MDGMNERPPKVSRRKVLKWGAAGLVAGTALGVMESHLERSERAFRLPRWKADGFRIAHVTDVHLLNPSLLEVAQQAVRWAVESKPDLFVFTGDFLNQDDESLARIQPAFEALHDIGCPCLAVLGNHDYWSHATAKIAEEVSKTRLRLLVNQTFDTAGVRVVGLDDALGGQPDYGLVGAQDADSTVVLLHEPDYVAKLPTRGSLVLSGHSHGGEICLPGGIPLYTPKGAKKYQSGYYPGAATPLFVNRGTGTLGPTRVYCPPEVAILTLQGQ